MWDPMTVTDLSDAKFQISMQPVAMRCSLFCTVCSFVKFVVDA